jgi:hypothetical protein
VIFCAGTGDIARLAWGKIAQGFFGARKIENGAGMVQFATPLNN